jgi:hypothetical protein
MHEVGHNLGLGHSNEGAEEYGDESCIMGSGFSDDGALLCYNGAKSWQLGWYDSRNHIYNIADGIWNGRLIGQVDYGNDDDSTSSTRGKEETEQSYVILQMNTPDSFDYYVMFNRIKSGTVESMNKVMITRNGNNKGGGEIESDVLGKLGSGESITLPNFYLWESLELTVNNIDLDVDPAYADITVKLGSCVYNCGATLDTWSGIGGLTIEDLTSATNNLSKTPNKSDLLMGLLEAPTNADNNYGIRMSGWLVPPVTGDYEFWIASDDHGEFWLSTDDDSANKVRICRCEWALPRWWDLAPEQKSVPISLVAGQAYYYEVRFYVSFISCISAQYVSSNSILF